ncbi:major facilitator superfamily domain-containing protein [Mycena galericulata]|nr:major facilitator superfamily domain-containing protein [Mycena galericulata]
MDDSQEERERSVGKDTRTETSSSAVGPALPQTDLELVPLAFPEGGARAWATVAGAFLVQFCGFGYTTSFGVYQDFYTRNYLTHSSSSAISWIGSVNALLVISGGLFAGRLYDRGHFYALLYGGATLQCFSLFMLSLCKPEQFYQIFLAQGLGAGTVYVPSVAVVSHYFQKRRALAMIVVPSARSHLGFGDAVRASAGLVSGLMLVACCVLHDAPARASRLRGRSPRFGGRCAASGGMCRMFWRLSGLMPIYYAGFYFPLFYLQLDAVKHGINETFSFYSLVIMNASSFMVVLAAGCGAVLILSMIALKTIASVVVIGVLYGFWAGVFVTLMAPLVAALTQDMGELGLRMGVSFGVMGLGGLVGPPIHGALLTGEFIWWRPALFSGLMAFIGFAFFVATLVAVRRRRGRVGKVPVENENETEKERKKDGEEAREKE